MASEERRVAPAGRRRREDVASEQLQNGDARRDGAPEDDAEDDERQIATSAHEQRDGYGEQRVLDELEEAHEVGVESLVVQRGRA